MSGTPSPPDLPADLVEEMEGILSVFREDPRDPQDLLDLLACREALRRLPESPESRSWGDTLEEAIDRSPSDSFEAALDLVSAGRWLEDYTRLVSAFEGEIGTIRDPRREAAFAEEAGRLFRLLDSWRLALLGMGKRPGLPSGLRERVEERLAEIEEGPVERVLARPEVFADAGPLAADGLTRFREDLDREEERLASTADIYAAVAQALEVPGAPPGLSLRGSVSLLPPPVALAAAGTGGPLPRVFVWESPEGGAEARLVFLPRTPREEERHRLSLKLHAPPGHDPDWPRSARVRLFGLEAPLEQGEASFHQAALRRAAEEEPESGLEVRHPELPEWVSWRWRAPFVEDAD